MTSAEETYAAVECARMTSAVGHSGHSLGGPSPGVLLLDVPLLGVPLLGIPSRGGPSAGALLVADP